jgi:hypothetical protein
MMGILPQPGKVPTDEAYFDLFGFLIQCQNPGGELTHSTYLHSTPSYHYKYRTQSVSTHKCTGTHSLRSTMRSTSRGVDMSGGHDVIGPALTCITRESIAA